LSEKLPSNTVSDPLTLISTLAVGGEEDVGWHSRAICRKGVISFKYIGHDATVEQIRILAPFRSTLWAGFH